MRRLIIISTILILLTFLIIPMPATYAATITVNSADDNLTGNDNLCTLREAIMNANSGTDTTSGDCLSGVVGLDTIVFDNSLNGVPITLSLLSSDEHANADGDLDITDDLTIAGTDARATIIDGNGAVTGDRVFHLPTSGITVEFKGMTIQNGRATGANINPGTAGADGGGILVSSASTVTLNDMRLTSNFSDDEGGGLYVNAAATVTINRSLIDNNQATGTGHIPAGGAIFVLLDGTVNVNHTTISGNTAVVTGGVEAQLGTATLNLNHVTLTNNNATNPGSTDGLRTISNGTITLQNSIISGNDNADCYNNGGTLTSLDYNVVGDNANPRGCPITGTNDAVIAGTTASVINPALANNGGDTDSHAVISRGDASDRIPSGSNNCGTTNILDQRGRPRPADNDLDGTAACDVGAYETELIQQCSLSAGNTYDFSFISGNTVSLHINTLGDMDCLYVVEWLHSHANGHLTLAADQWWHITATNSGGSPATGYNIDLTLPHIGFSEPSVCKFPGTIGTWDCAFDSFTSSTVTRLNITELSDWAVGDRVGPTAVTLHSLTANTHLPTLPLLLLILALTFTIHVALRHITSHHVWTGQLIKT